MASKENNATTVLETIPEEPAPKRTTRKKLPDSRPSKPSAEDPSPEKKKPAARKAAPKKTTAATGRKPKPACKKPIMGPGRPKGSKNKAVKKNKPPAKRNKNAKRTTAHDLLTAIQDDEIPTNAQVKADYGFSRCYITLDQSKLYNVYRTVLEDFEVKPEELHEWLHHEDGLKNVAAEIKAKFEALLGPEDYQGDYKWFLENQYIWDPEDLVSEAKAARAAKELKEYYDARKRPGDNFDWYS
ncbi:hypothetical protein HER10_EVM0009985 [Colletotrichum scovillei]|uniref:Uncharacterized protein n=1 Tax=Colletotrichum scovillei TaxID=1209932 RepID=A0A9P7UH55_9PEZI|nr:uncharacterized protein HER10_EVM0009985 [Colletotrichum scovillei]KAF4783441.1 hypothetical protein HER10_EVM0009985 [Colletotrichum scovillei]KAG7053152.1 hypothetical protein JMJ77_0000244 [Colletotrichum scovillei]KAG7071448.1 hypothetical protein JMJ76_0004321 [Colletotrichum scovillei]KAG7079697.1 hypothetical protein JMJ78_0006803 [Colletotrichum scovillei]